MLDALLFGDIFTLLKILLKFSFFIIILSILYYVLQSVGYQRIAQNAGKGDSGKVWIPVYRHIYIGDIIGPIKIFEKDISNIGYIKVGVWACTIVFCFVPVIPTIIFIVGELIFYYYLFKRYSKEYFVIVLVSALTGFLLLPIFVYAIRNNAPREMPAITSNN